MGIALIVVGIAWVIASRRQALALRVDQSRQSAGLPRQSRWSRHVMLVVGVIAIFLGVLRLF